MLSAVAVGATVGVAGCTDSEDGSEDESEGEASVTITEPAGGDTVGTEFTVSVDVENYDIRDPNDGDGVRDDAGHAHVLVDVDPYDEGEGIPFEDQHFHYSDGQLSDTITVEEPGEYEITAQLGNDAHMATDIHDTITVTVE